MSNGSVLRHVHRLFGQGTLAGLSEGQLLDRFASRRDEAAFEALVERHGPMVLGVCRRLLRDPHAAEDAFQAVFLVLVRKAGSIRRCESLGPWLYRVAHRVATRANVEATRRRTVEGLAVVSPEAPADDPDAFERRILLWDELARLPSKYRDPIVLCHIEGFSHDDAATALRWPVGTVKGRLSRAKDLLRDRLARRGLGVVALTALGSEARATVPPTLNSTTIKAAVGLAEAGWASAGSASVAAIFLAKGAVTSMFLTKLKTVAAVVLTAGLLSAGWGFAVRGAGDTDGAAQAANTARSEGPSAKVVSQPPATSNQTILQEAGNPFNPAPGIAGAGLGPTPSGSSKAEQDEIAVVERLRGQRYQIEVLERQMESNSGMIRKLRDALDEHDMKLILTRLEGDPDVLNRQRSELARALKQAEDDYFKGKFESMALLRDLERVADPGDVLNIEVLEALPGRPVTGERVVRPDGTISLGFYGDVFVAGLTRKEIKVKVVEQMRKFIPAETLGLSETSSNPDGTRKTTQIAPADSIRVFVDDAIRPGSIPSRNIDDLLRKMDRVLEKLDDMPARPRR